MAKNVENVGTPDETFTPDLATADIEEVSAQDVVTPPVQPGYDQNSGAFKI